MADQVTAPPVTPSPAAPAAAPAAVTAAPPVVAPAAPTEWTAGFADDLKGYVGTKGFKDPASLADSYRQLEKLVGVKDKLLKLPDTEDSPEWNAIHERLGKPKTADEYGLKPVEGNPKAADFAKWAKETFHGVNLTKTQAEKLMGKFQEYDASINAKEAAANQAVQAQAESELKTKWGNAFEQNMNIAKAAATNFGISKDTIAGIEKTLGTVKTFELFQSIGKGLGEATFTQGVGKGGGAMDPSTARATLNQMKADPAAMKLYAQGDAQVTAKMNKLFQDLNLGDISV